MTKKLAKKKQTVKLLPGQKKRSQADKLLAAAIERSDYDGHLHVRKIDETHYMFGTRQIMVKIVNDRLLIRVASNYMAVDEFVHQYGRMEFIKELAEEEKKHGQSFADPAEVKCSDEHHHDSGEHYHKAGVTAPKASVHIKELMKEADVQI